MLKNKSLFGLSAKSMLFLLYSMPTVKWCHTEKKLYDLEKKKNIDKRHEAII